MSLELMAGSFTIVGYPPYTQNERNEILCVELSSNSIFLYGMMNKGEVEYYLVSMFNY